MSKQRIGIYPGTFDPITNGHTDLVERASKLFDHIIVAIAASTKKGPLLALEKRVDLAQKVLSHLENVEVCSFNILFTRFAKQRNSTIVIRGLRAVSDFEFEFQMVGTNARLNPDIETLFLMASEHHQFISSRFVKEIANLGGDVSSFVSPAVTAHLTARVADLAERPYSSS